MVLRLLCRCEVAEAYSDAVQSGSLVDSLASGELQHKQSLQRLSMQTLDLLTFV